MEKLGGAGFGQKRCRGAPVGGWGALGNALGQVRRSWCRGCIDDFMCTWCEPGRFDRVSSRRVANHFVVLIREWAAVAKFHQNLTVSK